MTVKARGLLHATSCQEIFSGTMRTSQGRLVRFAVTLLLALCVLLVLGDMQSSLKTTAKLPVFSAQP